MRIICDGLELCDAALKVCRALSQKTTNPVLEGIKIFADENTVTLSATDLEIAIEKTIRADVISEGQTIVPGKIFAELCRKMTNEKVELYTENEKMFINYCESESCLQTFNGSEYPSFKEVDKSSYFKIKPSDFKEVVAKSIFAVASDDSRPILKGCLFEINQNQLTSVALDGFRLAVARKPIISATSNFRVVVPARCLLEISKNLVDDGELECFICENHLMVFVDGTKIITRLMQGDYINYNQIIPNEYQTIVSVNKNQLEDSLERAILLSKTNQNNLIKLQITDGVLNITSNSEIGNISEKVVISKTGDDLVIAFNAGYFLECLKACTDEFVNLFFNKPIHPCKILPTEGDEFLYLVLPVRMM